MDNSELSVRAREDWNFELNTSILLIDLMIIGLDCHIVGRIREKRKINYRIVKYYLQNTLKYYL